MASGGTAKLDWTLAVLNRNLSDAKLAKEDEFYTQLTDIERELRHYKRHFKGKVVYCNCDDPRVSNFFHYFSYNFEKLGLKKLVATCYRSQQADLFRGSIRVPLTTSPSGDAQVGVHGRHFAILSISLRSTARRLSHRAHRARLRSD